MDICIKRFGRGGGHQETVKIQNELKKITNKNLKEKQTGHFNFYNFWMTNLKSIKWTGQLQIFIPCVFFYFRILFLFSVKFISLPLIKTRSPLLYCVSLNSYWSQTPRLYVFYYQRPTSKWTCSPFKETQAILSLQHVKEVAGVT